MVDKDNQVSGNLLSIQIKATENINLKNDKSGNLYTSFSGIKISTVNYWYHLPIPVFLVVVDVSNENIFYASVKRQIRRNYNKLNNQKTMSFYLYECCSSLSEYGFNFFVIEYFIEKKYYRLSEYARTLFVHWGYYLQYLHDNLGRDCFLPVEEPEIFIHIFKSIRELASILSIDWEAAELKEILEYDRQFNDCYWLHSLSMDEYIPKIEIMFFKVFKRLRELIINEEKQYWKKEEFIIYTKASNLSNVTYENREHLLYY